jgi:formylglycine-generating enzyme required for sulfatase activity
MNGWKAVSASIAALTFCAGSCATETRKAGDQTLDLQLAEGVVMKLALIPAGKFTLGRPAEEAGRFDNEGPQREVSIPKCFYMGVCEVSQAEYEAVMANNPSQFKDLTRPVEQVSWDEAVEFCNNVSQMTGRTVRLPTEAEWEYACRAGSKGRFSFGDSDADLGAHAWFGGNSGNMSHPVGRKKPNAWGLYDMHGNIDEWCADGYADTILPGPGGPTPGAARVLRGGSWFNDAGYCRSAGRIGSSPVNRDGYIGFRVVVAAAVD